MDLVKFKVEVFVLSVLPSFSIVVQPEVNYISFGNFKRFCFKVEAR